MAKRIQLGIMKDFNSIRCCLIDSVFKVIVNTTAVLYKTVFLKPHASD